MDKEQQQLAIAEACGWSMSGHYPDYLNDLNAMHEAEKLLSRDQWSDYTSRLPKHYSAEQAAEAFLKTLNLWTEQPNQTVETNTMKHPARTDYPDANKLPHLCERPTVIVAVFPDEHYLVVKSSACGAFAELKIVNADGDVEYSFLDGRWSDLTEAKLNEATETASRWVRRKMGLPEDAATVRTADEVMRQLTDYVLVAELYDGYRLLASLDGDGDVVFSIKYPTSEFIVWCIYPRGSLTDGLIEFYVRRCNHWISQGCQ